MFSYLCVTEFFNLNVYGNVIKRKKWNDDDVSFCYVFINSELGKKNRVVIKSVCRMPNKNAAKHPINVLVY